MGAPPLTLFWEAVLLEKVKTFTKVHLKDGPKAQGENWIKRLLDL